MQQIGIGAQFSGKRFAHDVRKSSKTVMPQSFLFSWNGRVLFSRQADKIVKDTSQHNSQFAIVASAYNPKAHYIDSSLDGGVRF